VSRSYRAPYASVTGVRSAADDKRFAARGVRRKQNQWLRETADFEDAIVPHRFECPWNDVYSWDRDGKQSLQVLDDRDWSRHCLQQNGLHPYESSRWRDRNEWPPRWFERLQRQ
jgi:hypothetical protein